ncbi:MAG TPA: serine hydrolase domain-containing protein, partial [Tenuifilaceae bacterium]|nr:serine hydrolase domain-containing protein [Tenuifilaceae bacterium]
MHKRVKFIAAAVFILLGAIFLAFRYDKGVFSKGLTYSGLKYPTVNTLKITNALTSSSEYEWLNNAFSSFIAKWELTGASVAIAKDGRLIYARGFGYASKEENIPMEPYNLLRVASVSKLITATAVMKLVEENKIQLDSKVFGPNGILNDNIFLNYKDKRVEDITVKNLLNHSAGWSTRWGDHMF